MTNPPHGLEGLAAREAASTWPSEATELKQVQEEISGLERRLRVLCARERELQRTLGCLPALPYMGDS